MPSGAPGGIAGVQTLDDWLIAIHILCASSGSVAPSSPSSSACAR